MTLIAQELTSRNSRLVSVGIISISTFSVVTSWNNLAFGLGTSLISGVVVIGFDWGLLLR